MAAAAQTSGPKATRQSDVIYGRKFGVALIFFLLISGSHFRKRNQRSRGVTWTNGALPQRSSTISMAKFRLFTDLSTARHQCRTWPVAQRPALFLF